LPLPAAQMDLGMALQVLTACEALHFPWLLHSTETTADELIKVCVSVYLWRGWGWG
jgi:hypothetical protein